MGHYASEMDPDWGKPTPAEINLGNVEDERVKCLAQNLFWGFDSMAHMSGSNSERGVRVAEIIDELIKVRIEEALNPANEASE